MLFESDNEENKMNEIEKVAKPVTWFMAFLLTVFAAGCGGSSSGTVAVSPAAPKVSYTIPAANATGVATNSKVTATFSKDMAPATITTSSFTLVNTTLGGMAVTGAVVYDIATKTAIFTPTSTLPASSLLTAKISTAVTDAAGDAMAVAKTWSFTTGATADTTPPTVSSTVPADLATGVALNATVSAFFSEAMDPLTINATTITLMQGATPVAGTVSYVSANASFGTSAVFKPASNLAASTAYTVTVTTGVKDLAGNALAVAKTWGFTTGTTVAAGPALVLLGTAANYAILAKTGVSTVPTSVVTGNVGVSPVARTYLTGWSETYDVTDTYATSPQVVSPGKLYAADLVGGTTSADLGTAVLDMGTAYTDAAGRTATSAATTNVGAGTLTSLTLTPGVYEWGSAVSIPTDLTLNGSSTDVWIFKVAGTLDMAAAKNVILSGGALPQNIFWQVSGAVTIGAGSHFAGIILGQTSITFNNLSSINGRLLAQTAVVLDATTVTQP
ncbi:hypothetical protein GALL_123610 [mine drainage metagenome]|uniref:SbsA Ig-like domain-containing protein n=1 Tax=mine drainage metagenome TaxID=410659 RepID=A0A1J5SAQ2_9ZZZZ